MHRIILDNDSEDALAIKAVEALVSVESYKAELRGRPRIKAMDYSQLPKRRERRPSTVMRDLGPGENEPPKESLATPPTVTAPPPVAGD